MQLPELERLRAALDQRNARIIEIEDDNEFQRKVIGEQEDKIETLAAELAEAREGRWPDVANVLNGYVAALAQAKRERDEAHANYMRWHQAYCDAKYPESVPLSWQQTAAKLVETKAALAQAEARVAELAAQRPATMRQALEQLSNGFKYSTEVVTIARNALASAQETEAEPNTYTHPYMRRCNRCQKEIRFKEPCLATVVYCDVICAD